ncbi:hypothetical protein P7K49_008678 [Saguinus oedipus]|uniref:Uncharacterized protein n=1 Tax=Saguinus oedipus TaxID=9490 RepID=A0ABQ9W200_SAGOE|nr:hypothetical protein P7K49_008678 [Saguinus oedipus]
MDPIICEKFAQLLEFPEEIYPFLHPSLFESFMNFIGDSHLKSTEETCPFDALSAALNFLEIHRDKQSSHWESYGQRQICDEIGDGEGKGQGGEGEDGDD